MDHIVTRLDDLRVSGAAGVYLRPRIVPAAGRVAARVGGGWAGFDSLEILVRVDAGVARAGADIDTVMTWSRRRGADIRHHVEETLARITAPRPDFAGVAMDRPRIMGIVNVTPDSFSDGGDFASADAAVAHALDHLGAGASFLDIGGESTRPGSDAVAADVERDRVLPVIRRVVEAATGAVIFVDTRKAVVMAEAVAAGAAVVNDISALTYDADALATVAKLGVPVVLMHCLGDPKTMQHNPTYRHAQTDIFDTLSARVAVCEEAGIPRERIAVDPGIGFGKGIEHNLAVLADLALFHGIGCPLLVGTSRKSFIGRLAGVEIPRDRVPGSLATALWSVGQGAQIVRVHDTAETAQALAVWRGLAGGTA
ncbi:MAG: dihydropteroate synthase [Alphaproteobacteria bacterium]|nr:dihydropteroate synthase [Alphaproteobacteria bacterium]